ncbi:MAG: serine/threonine protein kinase, partial [Myxococcales bacterium]|nr:serine/threonine protein kinase [Myxococcales bacterium]
MAPEPFGGYTLVRKLATGGTADIYLARRDGVEGFARHLAIKRILPNLAGDAAFVRLLLDEARLAAHLHHPHIVQIHEVDLVESQAYIAMEYLPGTDLGRLLREARRRTRRVVVAHPDVDVRTAIIQALCAQIRPLEVAPAANATEIAARSASGAIDLAILAPNFAENARDALQAAHPELLRTLILGRGQGRGHGAYTLTTPLDDPEAIASLAHGCLRPLMPLELAIQIVRAVTDALDYAHQACDYEGQPLHIVHRDINPSNVLVSMNGTVKLVDFGIARAATSGGGRKRGFVGTYDYMSPEQTEGDDADARSDLFSLGTLLHELVTGHHPYRGEEMFSTMRAIREDEPPGIEHKVPGLPVALADIARRAGQKQPEARYPNAEAMLADLEHFVRREGLNLSPKRLAGFVRVIFGHEEVQRFGVTTTKFPAIRIEDVSTPVAADDDDAREDDEVDASEDGETRIDGPPVAARIGLL